jgi:hypothetical protein
MMKAVTKAAERTTGVFPRAAELVTSSGASARVEGHGSDESLVLRDGEGRLVFEYCPRRGRTVLHVPTGDLEIEVPGAVRVRAGTSLELTAPDLSATAARARLVVDEGSVLAKTLATTAERLVVAVSSLETRAVQIVEKARDAFREVEGLSQTTAGRMRLLTRGTFHLLGKRTLLKAEDDLKIDGERIHLG